VNIPTITGIDHVVLYAGDVSESIDFYTRVLGMTHVVFEDQYHALHFGEQKINLHDAALPWSPHARAHPPGGLDLCLVTDSPIEDVVAHLVDQGVDIELGPCPQTGAVGPMVSVYIRDPDGNLVEIATRAE
jgi:catechol 2,3-dioxygenase-like lactoylglutathione lyase family enzyme